jgi:hypothetical protein
MKAHPGLHVWQSAFLADCELLRCEDRFHVDAAIAAAASIHPRSPGRIGRTDNRAEAGTVVA